MRTLAVGIIGHVDHGKTALVGALTGMETDRLAEEKRRGISIALGYAHLSAPGGEIDLIDMPGHERFVRTMVGGATGIGAVLLVVSAVEGIRAQTVEHVEIAGLLGVGRGIVAVTKCDLVPPERAQAVGQQAAALLAANGIGEAPVIETSALDGSGMAALREALAALMAGAGAPVETGLFHLPIDRAFAVAGFGTIVTGTLQRGRLALGDEVELGPAGLRARVRGLQVHGRPVEACPPGGRVAVNLRGADLAQVARGQVLATPGLVQPAEWLDVGLRLLPDAARPLRTGQAAKLLLATREVAVRLRLLDRVTLHPGEAAPAQLRCLEPVGVPAREPFVLRTGSPPRTVAGGIVLDPAARRRRRHDRTVLDRLDRLRRLPPRDLAADLVREAGTEGVALDEVARLTGTSPAWALSWLTDAGAVQAGDRAVCRTALDQVAERVLEALAAFHRSAPTRPGPMRAELAGLLPPGSSDPVLDAALALLERRGAIQRSGGLLRRTGFRPTVQAGDGAAVRQMEASLRAAGLCPPEIKDLVAGGRLAAVQRLVRDGVLVRTLDRVQKRELLFHRDAVRGAARTLSHRFGDASEGFLLGEAARALGITRKYAVPLLEHLDSIGATRRQGDRRVIRTDRRA